MISISKKLLGLVLLVLAAAMPLGCGSTEEGPRKQPATKTTKDVKVGGDKGVVVERSSSGTAVKVGGDRGVVVGHPRDQKDGNQR